MSLVSNHTIILSFRRLYEWKREICLEHQSVHFPNDLDNVPLCDVTGLDLCSLHPGGHTCYSHSDILQWIYLRPQCFIHRNRVRIVLSCLELKKLIVL